MGLDGVIFCVFGELVYVYDFSKGYVMWCGVLRYFFGVVFDDFEEEVVGWCKCIYYDDFLWVEWVIECLFIE